MDPCSKQRAIKTVIMQHTGADDMVPQTLYYCLGCGSDNQVHCQDRAQEVTQDEFDREKFISNPHQL